LEVKFTNNHTTTATLTAKVGSVPSCTVFFLSTFAGGHLEPWYYGHRAGQGRSAKLPSTSDEGAIFNSEKRPAAAGGKLQQVVPRVRRPMSEQRTGKRKRSVYRRCFACPANHATVPVNRSLM